jgi:MFS family permease
MIGFAAALLLTVAFTYLSGWIAGRRGRSTKFWYWLGAIFGPFAVLAIALLSPLQLGPTVKLDNRHESVPPGPHGPMPRLGNARTAVAEWSGVVGLVRKVRQIGIPGAGPVRSPRFGACA